LPAAGAAGARAAGGALVEFVVIRSAERDDAFFDQTAHHLQDFLLFGLDLGDAHRAACFELLAQRLGRAGRNVLEYLLAQLGGGALQRYHERLGLHFLHQRLDRLVVDLDEVVEREHVVHDPLRQLAVGLAHVLEHRGLDAGAHQVQHLGRRLDAAERRLAHRVGAGQQRRHHLVQVLQRRRLDAVERRDPHHDLVAVAFGEQLQHRRGLVEVEVDQDRRDDLRVLVAQQLGDRSGVHPLEALDAGDVGALQDAVEQQGGLVFAERLAQHRADVLVGVVDEAQLLLGDRMEELQHGLEALARDRLHARDRLADALHFLRRQVLQHLGGVFLAERHQQDRGILEAGLVHRAASAGCR
jgi:hypothetical protein